LAWSWKDAGAHVAHAATAEAAHSHGEPEHPLADSRAGLLASLGDPHDQVRATAAEKLGKLADPAVLPELVRALRDPSPAVKEKAAVALGALGQSDAAEPLAAALAQQDEDEWVHLRVAEALVRCGDARGMAALIAIAGEAEAKLVRMAALRSALAFAGRPDAQSLDGDAGDQLRGELATWWSASAPSAHWDAASARFMVGVGAR
jgi:hypothetical protein